MKRGKSKNTARQTLWLIVDRVRAMERKRLWLITGIIVAATVGVVLGIRSWMSASGQQEKGIIVGAILPQTGAGAVFAQYIREGIDLAVEEINAQGQPKIRILYEDSKNQPKEGVTVYNKLVSTQNPPVVIVALSSVAKALAPLAAQSKTVQVYVAVAIPDITDGEYTFRVYPEAFGMAGVMARFNAKHLNAKNSAVIYLNDDFGRVSLEAYAREFESHGGRVVYAESYELQQTDFRSQISKLKSVSPMPDVIYLNGYGASYGAIARQLREQNVQSQLTTDMTMGLPDTLEQVGTAADGVYFVDGKMSKTFIDKFKRRYQKDPSSYAGYAYDIVKIIYKTSQEQGAFTAENVRRRMLKIDNYEGAMGNITVQANGDSNLQFVVKQVKGQVIESVPEL